MEPAGWFWMSVAAVSGAGWLLERRRRRTLERERDSILWADVQPPATSQLSSGGDTDTLAIGQTASRREATLIDLHALEGKLARRHLRGDAAGAASLLQQHLVDFRYTSPWVFLELRELYRRLGRRGEWEMARQAFRQRFGQNAPAWDAPSDACAQLLDDTQLCDALTQAWPFREARMFLLRWLLGDPRMRQDASGPPLLQLGVYRDLLAVDLLLDAVLQARPVAADSLL